MANEKNEKTPAAQVDALGPRIPVKALYFRQEHMMPGMNWGSSLNGGGGPRNQARWDIDFLPRVAMYEVRYSPPSSDKVETRIVPKEWAAFEPLVTP